MLDLVLLGVLDEGPLHGYELRKRLKDRFGSLANVSFGSIYPALSRLERGGAVEAVESLPSISIYPPTGSISGERAAMRAMRKVGARGRRSRKAFRITIAGRSLFRTLLTDNTADDSRSFSLRLSLAGHLDAIDRARLLQQRAEQLRRRREELPDVSDPSLDFYARSVREHVAQGVLRDIAWIDGLIATERDGTDATDVKPTDARSA
ncbi:MAG: PadR family transcriptional regulator [Acidimicrobiales bacterium]